MLCAVSSCNLFVEMQTSKDINTLIYNYILNLEYINFCRKAIRILKDFTFLLIKGANLVSIDIN